MIQIGALFRVPEIAPASLPAGSSASFANTTHKVITIRGFDLRLDTGNQLYEFSTRDALDGNGFHSRRLGFARRMVPLAPGISLEQQILLSNRGDAVAISWCLVAEKIGPILLTATPIFSSAVPISNESFHFDSHENGGRLTWLPFRRAAKIIADTNGCCTAAAVTIDADQEENSVTPSAFVFDLGRHPSLLLISAELPTNGALDPVMGAFLADLAIPKREQHRFLCAA